MPKYKFNPPLTLKDRFVVRSLDDAVCVIVEAEQPRRMQAAGAGPPAWAHAKPQLAPA
jgi:hypothetical protein